MLDTIQCNISIRIAVPTSSTRLTLGTVSSMPACGLIVDKSISSISAPRACSVQSSSEAASQGSRSDMDWIYNRRAPLR